MVSYFYCRESGVWLDIEINVYHRELNPYTVTHPHSSIDITRRALSHTAPTVWNNLATDICFADSFMNFRSLLYIHFYRLAFN